MTQAHSKVFCEILTRNVRSNRSMATRQNYFFHFICLFVMHFGTHGVSQISFGGAKKLQTLDAVGSFECALEKWTGAGIFFKGFTLRV